MFLLLLLFFGSEKSVISKIAAFSPIKSLDFKKKKKKERVSFRNMGRVLGLLGPGLHFDCCPRRDAGANLST